MGGAYIYTNNLLRLENTAKSGSSATVDPYHTGVTTSLCIDSWKHLQHYPDQDFTGCILRGIQFGFHIGVESPVSLTSAFKNISTAHQHAEVINEYIQKEVS